MRWRSRIASAVALLGFASQIEAADSVVYRDGITGFTFSSYDALYALGQTMTFRIALPSNATASAGYNTVVQLVAPVAVGWGGLAWGGTMIWNPLTVAWSSGSSAVVSSRYATGHTTPTTYAGATYKLLKGGTFVNSTHWQYTALCTGCTAYTGSSEANVVLNPKGENRLAFAWSRTSPSSTSPDAAIQVHDNPGYWVHDFAAAANMNFDALVAQNM